MSFRRVSPIDCRLKRGAFIPSLPISTFSRPHRRCHRLERIKEKNQKSIRGNFVYQCQDVYYSRRSWPPRLRRTAQGFNENAHHWLLWLLARLLPGRTRKAGPQRSPHQLLTSFCSYVRLNVLGASHPRIAHTVYIRGRRR